MKISCIQENLQKGLSAGSHIAHKASHLPILHNILLRASDIGIELISTNLEIGIKALVRGKVESQGEFTVPAQLLNNYVSLLPNERIDIQIQENDIILSSGSAKTKIKGQPASEFPLIPEVERKNKTVVNGAEFQKILSRVVIAAAFDDSRPELHGVLFHFSNEGLTLAATDSYRLAEGVVSLKEYPGTESKVIVPLEALQELVRIMQNYTNEVEIYKNDNQILFVLSDVELVSRIVEGQYPEYKPIIPKEFQTTAKVPIAEFVKVIKAASLFSKSGVNDIALEVHPAEKVLKVSSVNNQLGENISSVPIEAEGQDNSIVFNYRFLLDGLHAVSGSVATLQIAGNANPGLIKGDDAKYLYVIMPIKQ